MEAIERVEEALKGKDFKMIFDASANTVFKVKLSKDSRFTLDFGYNEDKDTWYHNRNSGKKALNSVWNVSRDSNDKGIGWFSFTTGEILEVIKGIRK